MKPPHPPGSGFLTTVRLRAMKGQTYTGAIAAITFEVVHNGFNGTDTTRPIMYFDDDLRMVPNDTMRHDLIAAWGTSESDEWVGRVFTVGLRSVGKRLYRYVVSTGTGKDERLIPRTAKEKSDEFSV